MKYNTFKINNYFLHIIHTKKFKTISVKIELKEKLSKDTLMKRYFLGELLPLVSQKYRTERDIEIECEELYNTIIEFHTYKSGYYQIFSVSESFINEKLTEEGMNTKCIEFLKEIMFHPFTENNSFELEKFNRVKRLIKEDLESIKENPSGYAILKMREAMGKDELYSLHPFLLLDELDKITPKNLYEYYLNMLKDDLVNIVVIGDIDDSIMELFKDLDLPNNKKCDKSHIIENDSFRKEYQLIEENYQSNQSKLVMSFKLQELTNFERRYVLNLYSFILGGGGDSKLFKNLREKHSLCYYISSNYNNLYNVLEISAGINSKNKELSLQLIKDEIDNIKNGKIDDIEIEKGVNTYISACEEIYDKQSTIITDFLAHEYFRNDLVDDKIKNIKKVTKEDIINLSKKIHLDTIYLLKGESEND